MAGPTGNTSGAVSHWQELETQFASFEFFAALRYAECAHPALPRLGKSVRAAEEPARLGQVPSLVFAPTMFLEAQRREDGKLWLGGAFLGLFGPNGPLPLHLTEYAHDRRTNFRDPTLARFADVFHHRVLSLFYRAWADAQPVVHRDRPDSDRFRTYVGAVFGLGQASLRERDAMPDAAKLYHAGRLATQARNPEGLRAILRDFFGDAVKIAEFQGEWMLLAQEDRLRLQGTGPSVTLGAGATVGASVWAAQGKFRIVLGPLRYAEFERFLPGSRALGQLTAIVRNYVGYELAWDLQLVLDRHTVPGVRLGEQGRLAWTSWLGKHSTEQHADDVILNTAA
jgi:type VI secretion system protein ImpH